jgi:hypothetical protein
MQYNRGRLLGKVMPAVLLESDNFLDSDENIDDSEPENSSLQKRIGKQRTEMWEEIEEVIVIPDPEPGEKNQNQPHFKGVDNVE